MWVKGKPAGLVCQDLGGVVWSQVRPESKTEVRPQWTDRDVDPCLRISGRLLKGFPQWQNFVLKNYHGLGWRVGRGAVEVADQLGRYQISSWARWVLLGQRWKEVDTFEKSWRANGWTCWMVVLGVRGETSQERALFLDGWWCQGLGQEAKRRSLDHDGCFGQVEFASLEKLTAAHVGDPMYGALAQGSLRPMLVCGTISGNATWLTVIVLWGMFIMGQVRTQDHSQERKQMDCPGYLMQQAELLHWAAEKNNWFIFLLLLYDKILTKQYLVWVVDKMGLCVYSWDVSYVSNSYLLDPKASSPQSASETSNIKGRYWVLIHWSQISCPVTRAWVFGTTVFSFSDFGHSKHTHLRSTQGRGRTVFLSFSVMSTSSLVPSKVISFFIPTALMKAT